VKVVYSAAHSGHNPAEEIADSRAHSPHEHPGRAEIIRETLAADPSMTIVAPAEYGVDPIVAVHERGLHDFLVTAWHDYQVEVRPSREVVPDFFYRPSMRNAMATIDEPKAVNARLGWWCFETTTPITEGSYAAARGAVDVAMTATDAVLSGERFAYGACRPPGHHATRSLYGGYCFFNNAAIAAHHVATTRGVKVTVLDVDYHHGNGTQEIFYERSDVQYVSLHADPVRAYPYVTGHADETGAGIGRGLTSNFPLAAGATDDDFLRVLERACADIQRHSPEVLIVSLGVDTFDGDPICDLALTREGFRLHGAAVGALGLPTVVLQEGGYALAELGNNVQAWLHGLESAQ
jgi:acetoin utilization deacetylase AcuC-like enzyme